MTGTPINVAYPTVEDLHLRITLGACRFEARTGDHEAWVSGTYYDPTGKRPPRLVEETGTVRITEARPSFERIQAVLGGLPRYDIEFGRGRPFALTIETGASEFDLDLGGVPLSGLVIRQGAGRFELGFSAPNPHPMELLDVSSGAARVKLENLANANFSQMRLSGGAAGCELDFGGTLSRDSEVNIEAGLSGVKINVPALTAATLLPEITLGSMDVVGGFTMLGGALWNEAGVVGGGPLLTIHAGVRLGSLQLMAT